MADESKLSGGGGPQKGAPGGAKGGAAPTGATDPAKTPKPGEKAAGSPLKAESAAKDPSKGGPPAKDPLKGKTPAAPKPRGSRVSLVISVVALIVALAALGGGGWLFLQGRTLAEQHARHVQDAGVRWAQLADQTAIKSLDERTRTLAERAAARFEGLDKRISGLDQAMRDAAARQVRDERGWRLAEVEYILRIASHRLRLLQDVAGAIAALQTADRQLQTLTSPVFIPLREQIERDLGALRQVEQPDLPGIAIRLAALIDAVPELAPLARAAPEPEETGSVAGATSGFLKTLQRFVVIKRNEQPVNAPALRYAPVSHARLLSTTLRAAQGAALAANEAEYRRLVNGARETLQQHFDMGRDSSLRFAERLENLAAAPLVVALPDITASFVMLEQLRSKGAGSEEAAQ